MKKNDNDSSSFRRRSFLQATGVATIGAIGVEPISANQNNEYGRVSFVETGLYHRTTFPEGEGNLSFVDLDDPVEYEVDEAANVLYLNETADESTKRVIGDNNRVAKFVGLHPLPTTVDQRPTQVIITDLGRAYRHTSGLITAHDYHTPSLNVHGARDGRTEAVVISADDRRIQVEPGASASIRLPSTTVRAPVEKPTGEKVQNENIPQPKRAQRMETREETVTVTPIVEMQNYGQLDVVEIPR